MGRRRGTTIRESGNPAERCFYTALRVKGRFSMQSSNRYRSVLLCAVIALVSAIPWSFSVAAEGPVVPEPVIKTSPVESEPVSKASPVGSDPSIETSPVKSEPVIKASEVVVSATKTPVPVTHLTSAVEVITGEELERRQVKTVV